jgi:integrase
MGRRPTKNLNLPAGMRARERKYGTYYYLDTGKREGEPRKEIPLGSDYVAAVRKWAELTMSEAQVAALITFRTAAERYQREILPTKAPATQEVNLRELAWLYKFFDAPPVALSEIEPVHIRQYMDWRVLATIEAKKAANIKRRADGKPELAVAKDEGAIRANREKALFSHVWNFARSKGLTNKANPCAGIKGYAETGRDVYVGDDVYRAVHDAAEQPLRDAMDLAYLTGQRPADVLKLARSDIKDGALWIEQNKTGTKLRVSIEGELAVIIERIKSRRVLGLKLVNMMDGTPMTRFELRGALDRARSAASAAYPHLSEQIKHFQFRDLRAKAATDKEETHGIAAAQDQLGHSTATMTQHYVRHRKGKLVKPTK